MQAVYQVKNSHGQSVGYVLDDNRFYNDETVQKYSNLIQKRNNLPDIDLIQYNKQQYDILCKDNPIERDIQTDFEYWRDYESDKILQIHGTIYSGKTTEVLKFAYRNYEQILHVCLTDSSNSLLVSLVTGSVTISELDKYASTHNMPDYIDDRSTILIIDMKVRQAIK